MCAYYEDGTTKIKQGDKATIHGKEATIVEAKHIKASKQMHIAYTIGEKQMVLEVPYKTVLQGFAHLESKPKINEMGQEVVEGYACKPKNFDPNRPIMHFKYQIFICDDERCAKAAKGDKATHLREILKEMGLNQGEDRIKISRTGCFGACRFRQVAECVANTQANGKALNNALWLRHTHQWSDTKWRELFLALKEDRPLTSVLEDSAFIPMKVYGA